MQIFDKIRRKWMKTRLQPIRVFCFHQVSAEFDASTMWECDWTPIDVWKKKIVTMQEQGYEFISLEEAYQKLKHDWFRRKKYAVLTSDDGYATLKNILPWLDEQKIPITLFLNTKYLDGKSWSPINEEQAKRVNPNVEMTDVVRGMYLTREEIWSIHSPLVTIGMHGHEHLDATLMSEAEFEQNVCVCKRELEKHPRFIPYWAYTWGRHNTPTDAVLRKNDIVPVLIFGQKNYKYTGFIDRECFDGK